MTVEPIVPHYNVESLKIWLFLITTLRRLRDEEYMRQLEREEQQQAMDMMSEEEANRLEEIRLREIVSDYYEYLCPYYVAD